MKSSVNRSLFFSTILNVVKTSTPLKVKVFWVTIIYYCLMYFCNSNLTLFVLSFLYFVIVWKLSKNIVLTAALCFLVNLPFMKGKSLSLFLLPKEIVQMNIQRDLIYYFPVTISDFYLAILLVLQIRSGRKMTQIVSHGVVISLTLFFITALVSSIFSQNYMVSLLSSLILLKLFIIFLLPATISHRNDFIHIGLYSMAAFSLFEGSWSMAQFVLHGYLGRYIESFNSMYSYGKVAWENTNLLRVSGTFVDPDILGTFMFMHFVIFFLLWLKRKTYNGFEQKLFALCSLFCAISILITGNRILYILLFVSSLLLIGITKQFQNVINIIKKPVIVVCISGILLVFSPYVLTRMQNFPDVFSEVGSGTFRIQMFQYGARLGLNNWFGVGLGMSPYHFGTDFPGEKMIFGPDYPHNIFLQIFAEIGLFGLILYIVFLYISFRPLVIKGLNIPDIHYYLAAFAFIASACFYPIFIPLIELNSFFFLYLGIAVFNRHE
jgi:O-antigen ligase